MRSIWILLCIQLGFRTGGSGKITSSSGCKSLCMGNTASKVMLMIHKPNTFTDSPFEAHLEVVATIKDRVIEANAGAAREDEAMTVALRQAISAGASVSDLSNSSGLSPAEI